MQPGAQYNTQHWQHWQDQYQVRHCHQHSPPPGHWSLELIWHWWWWHQVSSLSCNTVSQCLMRVSYTGLLSVSEAGLVEAEYSGTDTGPASLRLGSALPHSVTHTPVSCVLPLHHQHITQQQSSTTTSTQQQSSTTTSTQQQKHQSSTTTVKQIYANSSVSQPLHQQHQHNNNY